MRVAEVEPVGLRVDLEERAGLERLLDDALESTSAGPRRLSFRPVRWPMQSTCGFSIAASTRSVRSLSKPECTEAITQSRSASTSSATSTSPFARMLASTPFRSLKRPSFSWSLSISRLCASMRPSRR